MSLGSENPELWDAICKRGIVKKMCTEIERCWYSFEDNLCERTAEVVIEILYEVPEIQKVLLEWSGREISEAEGDYLGDRIDQAYEALKE